VKGVVRPFPRGAEPRLLLVSDIDGTMIGPDHEAGAFASSQRFATYWDNGPVLCGSLLAYNTGRSIGQVRDELEQGGVIGKRAGNA
jgi:hypothetical protein